MTTIIKIFPSFGFPLRKEIFEVCEKNVADYAMPQEIAFRETMPLTAMGKVSFKKLMEEMEGKK